MAADRRGESKRSDLDPNHHDASCLLTPHSLTIIPRHLLSQDMEDLSTVESAPTDSGTFCITDICATSLV